MNKSQLVAYLERIDAALPDEAVAVRSLPPPFNQDAVVIENLKNLRNDMAIWMGSPS